MKQGEWKMFYEIPLQHPEQDSQGRDTQLHISEPFLLLLYMNY
jgi:hypothetical protein